MIPRNYVISFFETFFLNLQVPSINVPRIPAAAFDVFKSFFLAKHSGRILTLLPTTGTVDLNAVFYGTKDHKSKDSSTGSSVTSTPTVEVAGASAVVSVVPGTRSVLLQQIPFKNFSATSASNESLIVWKIALFQKKIFLVDQRPL